MVIAAGSGGDDGGGGSGSGSGSGSGVGHSDKLGARLNFPRHMASFCPKS